MAFRGVSVFQKKKKEEKQYEKSNNRLSLNNPNREELLNLPGKLNNNDLNNDLLKGASSSDNEGNPTRKIRSEISSPRFAASTSLRSPTSPSSYYFQEQAFQEQQTTPSFKEPKGSNKNFTQILQLGIGTPSFAAGIMLAGTNPNSPTFTSRSTDNSHRGDFAHLAEVGNSNGISSNSNSLTIGAAGSLTPTIHNSNTANFASISNSTTPSFAPIGNSNTPSFAPISNYSTTPSFAPIGSSNTPSFAPISNSTTPSFAPINNATTPSFAPINNAITPSFAPSRSIVSPDYITANFTPSFASNSNSSNTNSSTNNLQLRQISNIINSNIYNSVNNTHFPLNSPQQVAKNFSNNNSSSKVGDGRNSNSTNNKTVKNNSIGDYNNTSIGDYNSFTFSNQQPALADSSRYNGNTSSFHSSAKINTDLVVETTPRKPISNSNYNYNSKSSIDESSSTNKLSSPSCNDKNNEKSNDRNSDKTSPNVEQLFLNAPGSTTSTTATRIPVTATTTGATTATTCANSAASTTCVTANSAASAASSATNNNSIVGANSANSDTANSKDTSYRDSYSNTGVAISSPIVAVPRLRDDARTSSFILKTAVSAASLNKNDLDKNRIKTAASIASLNKKDLDNIINTSDNDNSNIVNSKSNYNNVNNSNVNNSNVDSKPPSKSSSNNSTTTHSSSVDDRSTSIENKNIAHSVNSFKQKVSNFKQKLQTQKALDKNNPDLNNDLSAVINSSNSNSKSKKSSYYAGKRSVEKNNNNTAETVKQPKQPNDRNSKINNSTTMTAKEPDVANPIKRTTDLSTTIGNRDSSYHTTNGGRKIVQQQQPQQANANNDPVKKTRSVESNNSESGFLVKRSNTSFNTTNTAGNANERGALLKQFAAEDGSTRGNTNGNTNGNTSTNTNGNSSESGFLVKRSNTSFNAYKRNNRKQEDTTNFNAVVSATHSENVNAVANNKRKQAAAQRKNLLLKTTGNFRAKQDSVMKNQVREALNKERQEISCCMCTLERQLRTTRGESDNIIISNNNSYINGKQGDNFFIYEKNDDEIDDDKASGMIIRFQKEHAEYLVGEGTNWNPVQKSQTLRSSILVGNNPFYLKNKNTAPCRKVRSENMKNLSASGIAPISSNYYYDNNLNFSDKDYNVNRLNEQKQLPLEILSSSEDRTGLALNSTSSCTKQASLIKISSSKPTTASDPIAKLNPHSELFAMQSKFSKEFGCESPNASKRSRNDMLRRAFSKQLAAEDNNSCNTTNTAGNANERGALLKQFAAEDGSRDNTNGNTTGNTSTNANESKSSKNSADSTNTAGNSATPEKTSTEKRIEKSTSTTTSAVADARIDRSTSGKSTSKKDTPVIKSTAVASSNYANKENSARESSKALVVAANSAGQVSSRRISWNDEKNEEKSIENGQGDSNNDDMSSNINNAGPNSPPNSNNQQSSKSRMLRLRRKSVPGLYHGRRSYGSKRRISWTKQDDSSDDELDNSTNCDNSNSDKNSNSAFPNKADPKEQVGTTTSCTTASCSCKNKRQKINMISCKANTTGTSKAHSKHRSGRFFISDFAASRGSGSLFATSEEDLVCATEKNMHESDNSMCEYSNGNSHNSNAGKIVVGNYDSETENSSKKQVSSARKSSRKEKAGRNIVIKLVRGQGFVVMGHSC